MIHATSLKFGTTVATTMGASGVLTLPTGVTSIDKISAINVVASIGGLTFTLPNALANTQQVMLINNTGATNSFTMYGRTVNANKIARFQWTGTVWLAESPSPLDTTLFDNDLGLGVDNKIETGFPLHRNTTTTGAFYRHWANNTTTNPALASSGVLTGWNSNLITGSSWNTSNITGSNDLVNGTGHTVSSTLSTVSGANHNIAGVNNHVFGLQNITGAGTNYSLLTGYLNNQTTGSYNMIQGYNNVASTNYSFVGGLNNGTVATPITGTGSLTYGNSLVQSANYSGLFGLSNTMSGNYNFGAGYVVKVNGTYNAAFGYNSDLSTASYGNLVGGYSHIVTGERGVIGGNGNTYAGAYGAMFGNSNTIASGVYGTQATGSSNIVSGGWNSLVAGDGNNVNAGGLYTKIALGYQNVVTTNTHVVFNIGQGNTVGNATGLLSNVGAGALGGSNNVQGQASIAIGYNNVINQHTSYAIGQGVTGHTAGNYVKIAGPGQLLGFYNVAPVARQTLPAVATPAQLTTALRNLGLIA